MFLKKSKIPILVPDSAHKFLLIIPIKFLIKLKLGNSYSMLILEKLCEIRKKHKFAKLFVSIRFTNFVGNSFR